MNYPAHIYANTTVVTVSSYLLSEYSSFHLEYRCAYAGAFVVATFFLSPDLDLAHSRPTSNWGRVRKIWRPYQRLCRHRGVSHWHVMGTLTRLAYVVGLFALAVFFLVDDWGNFLRWFAADWTAYQIGWVVAISAGVFLSDSTHIICDQISSFLKALWRRIYQ